MQVEFSHYSQTRSRGKGKKRMELQRLISHPHPLDFHEDRSDQSDYTFYCSGCEEEVLGPCFSCVDCGFYLHKECAEAPVEVDHPSHRDHPLILRLPSPYDKEGTVYCRLCGSRGKGFFYGCSSCEFYLDINCGLLPRDTNGNFIQTSHFAHQHPLILITNGNNHLKYYFCSGCSSELVDASFSCLDCAIFFHKKCLELPIEISHPYHRKHQLILHFEKNRRDCNLCESKDRGLFYGCSLCNVEIHSKCAWPPPTIEDASHHEHQFTLLLRPKNSFTCDACGIQGSNVSYICSTCNIQVHKDCISYPRFIRFNLHHHVLSRTFSLSMDRHDSRTWECKICYKKVDVEHGSYYCFQPDCHFIIHVKCAIENRELLDVIEIRNLDEIEKHNEELALLYRQSMDCITRVIKEIIVGEDIIAAEIVHISHGHNLIFSNEKVDNKHCNGCILPISSSFYNCSQCDFFLHKACVELSRKKLLWFDARPCTLHTHGIFKCSFCQYECNGFSYRLYDDDDDDDDEFLAICLRCAALSHSFTYEAHETHNLFFDIKYKGPCSACGSDRNVFCRCKDCNSAFDLRCVTLPCTAWHKCDKHPLTLAYGDDNDYALQHYCDICEEKRDPKNWFYDCKICDTTVHLKCVLGKYAFIKPGSSYTYKNHPHSLTFVQKIYYYLRCVKCGEYCQDLSLECVEHGCNYVVHWRCIKPHYVVYRRDCYSDSDSE